MPEPCVLVVPLPRESFSEGSTLAQSKGSPPGWERLVWVHTGQISLPSAHMDRETHGSIIYEACALDQTV